MKQHGKLHLRPQPKWPITGASLELTDTGKDQVENIKEIRSSGKALKQILQAVIIINICITIQFRARVRVSQLPCSVPMCPPCTQTKIGGFNLSLR